MDLASIRKWAATLNGEVVRPGDPAYDAARRIWNLDVERRPAAIVCCADETDVVRAVDFGRTQGSGRRRAERRPQPGGAFRV
jgi:hypothetical protein